MGSENDSGGPGYGLRPLQLIHLFQKERKSFPASGTGNGKIRHGSTERDLANGSELVRKERSREKDGLQKDSPDNKEGDEAILSKAMEDEIIQELHQRMDYFTHQVLGLLETGKAYFEDASTEFEEGVLLFHNEILETWEEIEGLRHEDLCTRVREARIVLDKLQVSASTVRRLEALSNC